MIQLPGDLHRRAGRPLNLQRRLQSGVVVIGIKVRHQSDVFDVRCGQGQQIRLPKNAAQAPEIAGVQIHRRRVFAHAQRHQILPAWCQRLRHIHIKRGKPAFVISDRFPVHENLRAIVHAVEMPQNFLAREAGRHIHPFAVKPHRVVRAIVSRLTVAQHLPVRRYGNRVPPRIIKAGLGKSVAFLQLGFGRPRHLPFVFHAVLARKNSHMPQPGARAATPSAAGVGNADAQPLRRRVAQRNGAACSRHRTLRQRSPVRIIRTALDFVIVSAALGIPGQTHPIQ